MKRHHLWIVAVLLAFAVPAAAHTNTYFGFSVGISNGPPPEVRYRRPPPVFLVPNTEVYVVTSDNGYDQFRYGPYWYVCDNDYWYRSRNYGGPYRAIDVHYVPTQIFYVPAERWRHYPAGLSQQASWHSDRRNAGQNNGWYNPRNNGWVDRRGSRWNSSHNGWYDQTNNGQVDRQGNLPNDNRSSGWNNGQDNRSNDGRDHGVSDRQDNGSRDPRYDGSNVPKDKGKRHRGHGHGGDNQN